MVSPSHQNGGRSQGHSQTGPLAQDVYAPTTPFPAEPISGPLSPVTGERLLVLKPRTTTQLSLDGSPTTRAKMPVIIPASHSIQASRTARRQNVPPHPHKRRPLVLFGSLLSCVLVLSIILFVVAPLSTGQHSQGLFSTLQHLISGDQSDPFQPASHTTDPTPTPLPTMPVAEGYCGGTDLWGTCATATIPNGTMGTGQMMSPIKGAVITQVFGNNEYQVVCGCWRPHTGIDLAAPYGTPITASDSGQVLWTGWDWTGLGWAVKINHGNYIATVYGHLARFIVSVGQNVTKGQVIAYEGSTGASTGPHVHFMVIVHNAWVNPALYMTLP